MTQFEKDFINIFNQLAPQYRRSELFTDMITLMGLEFYLVAYRDRADTALVEKFKLTRERYTEPERLELAKLLAIIVEALSQKPYDFLGTVFMALNLGDCYRGQYFTPPHLSNSVAKIVLQGCSDVIERKGFIALSEPACGSGVMVIEAVNTLYELGFNPQKQLWVECRDIDFIAAMMCYIQLTLLHIPAEVIVGNTLSNEVKYRMVTLAHIMGQWTLKLTAQPPKMEILPLIENDVGFEINGEVVFT